ncbi:MAG TPA: hypothetical protein VK779_11860 [Rhizomicrobium sp.]|jgi:hypothetical protein|nr:hypothetical protein [Rhizomicrobium sp.]
MEHRTDFWHKYIKPLLDIIQVVGVIIAACGLYYAGRQLSDTATQLSQSSDLASAQIGLRFDDRLKKPDMVGIEDAVEAVPQLKILISHGGKYNEDQLEQFIGDYDTIYYLHKQGLINDPLAYDLFCTDIEDAFHDPEVSSYLKEDRVNQGSATDYVGFDKMAALCLGWDKSGKARFLEE